MENSHLQIQPEDGKKLISLVTPEEEFLRLELPLEIDAIKDKRTYENLKKRKGFLKLDEKKEVSFQITSLGEELLKEDLGQEVITTEKTKPADNTDNDDCNRHKVD